METTPIKSILLVDDVQDSLDVYAEILRKKTNAHVICSRHPRAAIKLAEKYFFDIILIDVTITFNDTQFGGLEVYKNLKGRYGDSSLIVYSQFITDDLLRQYDYNFNFIEKSESPKKFIDDCIEKIIELRKRQSCFVAMPFSPAYNGVFEVIKRGIKNAHYRCVRIDQHQFTRSIVQEIFSEIDNAKLVIFLATDKNPNAFYECGYSVALNKEVITLTDKFENLPFDIRDRNAMSYGDDVSGLAALLGDKLSKLTDIPA